VAWLRNPLYFRELALICSIATMLGDPFLYGQAPQQGQVPGNQQQQQQLTNPQQMDSLVAPIALYPDSLVAQVLAASTYPLQIVTANRWVQQQNQLKGKALVEAAGREDWDPSVQALVAFPQLLQMMDQSLDWTTALGNAFLAQQSDVMAAVQRMRVKAEQSGKLGSNAQQQVQMATVEGQPTIVIQPTDPQVMYVPSYDPTVVYGAAPEYYPYPAVGYPTGGVLAASAISFGAGVAIGAIFDNNWGWGWGCNWGRHPSLYVNNNFFSSNRNAFINRGHWGGGYVGSGRAGWNHNPRYRGAVPYTNRDVANRFNGGRPGSMRPVQQPANIGNIRPPGSQGAAGQFPGNMGGNRPGAGIGPGQLPSQPGGGQRFGTGAGPSQLPANVGANRPANIGTTRPGGGQIPSSIGSANRAVPSGQWGGWSGSNAMPGNRGGAFAGASAGQVQQFSNRGGHSMGGGGFRGGGGGFRGGGGGRRR
jgi:hypothetical protein